MEASGKLRFIERPLSESDRESISGVSLIKLRRSEGTSYLLHDEDSVYRSTLRVLGMLPREFFSPALHRTRPSMSL